MKNNKIRITEKDLHNIIKESVNKILAENISTKDLCSQLSYLFKLPEWDDDPIFYADHVADYIMSIACADYAEHNNIDSFYRSEDETCGLHIENVKHLIEPLRQACLEELNKQYLELKQRAEDIYDELNMATKCIQLVEQNQDPEPYIHKWRYGE